MAGSALIIGGVVLGLTAPHPGFYPGWFWSFVGNSTHAVVVGALLLVFGAHVRHEETGWATALSILLLALVAGLAIKSSEQRTLFGHAEAGAWGTLAVASTFTTLIVLLAVLASPIRPRPLAGAAWALIMAPIIVVLAVHESSYLTSYLSGEDRLLDFLGRVAGPLGVAFVLFLACLDVLDNRHDLRRLAIPPVVGVLVAGLAHAVWLVGRIPSGGEWFLLSIATSLFSTGLLMLVAARVPIGAAIWPATAVLLVAGVRCRCISCAWPTTPSLWAFSMH